MDRGSIKLSRVDFLWIIAGAVVPIVLALVHYSRQPSGGSELWVTAALILGAFTVLTTRIGAVERSLEEFYRTSDKRDAALLDTAAAALAGPEMTECRDLLTVFKGIVAFGNPLMTALAQKQVVDLASFLAKFKDSLPFFPQNELITIDKHYTSFMTRMGRRGSYDATTFVQFWFDQDEEILRNFFHNNELAAHDGVTIRRVFLIARADERDVKTLEVLRRHSAISIAGYQNGGSITTRVLVAEAFSRDEDDFGIYMLDGAPKAIAIAKFMRGGKRLRGNEVTFDVEFMRQKQQLFEGRWRAAMDVHDFLRPHAPATSVTLPHPAPNATSSSSG